MVLIIYAMWHTDYSHSLSDILLIQFSHAYTDPDMYLMSSSTATNVEIELPISSDATTPSVRTSMGSAVYAPEKEALLWKIKSFPGGKVCCLG